MKKYLFIALVFCLFLFSCEEEEDTTYKCDNTSPNRVGAMCNDGTKSNSVGSGTCSSHGGVNYWLCN